jgi:threonine dehydratase
MVAVESNDGVSEILDCSRLSATALSLVFAFFRLKLVMEPSGVLGLAALLSGAVKATGKVGVIISGGNIDMNVVARVIEKGLVQEGRLVRLSLIVPDRPGALARVSTLVADQRANILEIMHSRGFSRAEIGETEITLTLETSGPQHITEVLVALRTAGYQVFEEQSGPA